MKTLFGEKEILGKRVRHIKLNLIGTVHKHRKGGRLTIIWDDQPGITDNGYLDEEFVLV